MHHNGDADSLRLHSTHRFLPVASLADTLTTICEITHLGSPYMARSTAMLLSDDTRVETSVERFTVSAML